MRSSDIAALLPEIMQAGIEPTSPLHALLEVMSEMHAPVEHVLDNLDQFLDPARCPDAFVPYLARWVALDWLVESDDLDYPIPTGVGRLRQVVSNATELSARRGTLLGMQEFFDMAMGSGHVVVSESTEPFTVNVDITTHPPAHRDFVSRVAEELKPAHVQLTITVGGAADQTPTATPQEN